MASLINALPGAVAQGLIWGIMAIGVYLTYRILDIADLTVDGSLGTGGAVCIMLMLTGHNVWVSLAGAVIAGRSGYWYFTYVYGNSGNSFRYSDTAEFVFCEFENYGQGKSGD